MDDSSTAIVGKSGDGIPLGMGSFAQQEREQFDQNIRLAMDIGRKSRTWPSAMARAIKKRDQHCVWPGCTLSHHLHISPHQALGRWRCNVCAEWGVYPLSPPHLGSRRRRHHSTRR